MSRRFRLVISGAFALLAIVLCAAYAQHVREEAESVRADALARYGGEVVSLVVADDAIEEGDVKRDVRWTADQIKQLRRRIGGPQLGLLIDAMQQANSTPPKEPDPLD